MAVIEVTDDEEEMKKRNYSVLLEDQVCLFSILNANCYAFIWNAAGKTFLNEITLFREFACIPLQREFGRKSK